MPTIDLVYKFHIREKIYFVIEAIPVHNLVAPFLLAVVVPGDGL